METITVVAAVVSALGTLVLGGIGLMFTRASAQQSARRAIGELASALARIRLERPEVLRCAATWEQADWDAVYLADRRPEADTLSRYYSYVEVGLEFCNATLAARADGALPSAQFDKHYGRLVTLFLVENWPIMAQLSAQPYLSGYVLDEIARLQATGFDFAATHLQNLGVDAPPVRP